MNAAERIQAYLDARAQQHPPDPTDTFAQQGLIARQGDAYLREVDLVVVLQMLDMLSRLLSVTVQRATDEAMPAQDFVQWAHDRAVSPGVAQ